MADANIIVKIIDQTRGGLGSVVGQVNQLDRSARSTGSTLEGMQRRIVAVGAAIATSFVVKNIIETTARFEDLRTTLSSVTGGIEEGAKAFDFITDFATRTQFGVEELTKTYIQLAANGIKPTEELLTLFTDAAAVTTDQLGVLEAITQVYNRTLQSQVVELTELDKLADRGLPVYDILQEKLGLSRAELGKFSKEAGNANLVLEALSEGIRERFGGATQERLANLSTAMSNFGIAVTNAADQFGQGFAPELSKATSMLTEFIANNEALIRSLGRLVGEGLQFVIQNIDTLVTVAGVFFAAMAVKKIADIALGFAALARGVLALNATMLSNPVALAVAAISAVVLLLISQWDNLRSAADSAFGGIEVAGLKLNKFFIQFLDFIVNDVVNGFLDMGRRAGNVLSALAKAALDPLNAFEVFRDELALGEEQIRQNQIVTVDFSSKIEDLDRRIAEASTTTNRNTGALGDNEDQTDDLASATDGLTKSTDDATDATDDHTGALDSNSIAARLAAREAESLQKAIEAGTRAVNESIRAYDNETFAMSLSEKQREIMKRVIQEEQNFRKSLGATAEALTEDQIRQILQLTNLQELYTSDFISLSREQIDAIVAGTEAREQATESRRIAMEGERKAAQALSDFTRDTERLNQSYYEATTTRSQQLTDQMNDYMRRAREQNRSGEASVQSAIQEFERQINDQRRKDHEELMRDYESDLRDFRSEYSAIYDDMFGVLEKFTGKSRSELDRYNQYAKLLFGVDLLGSFNGFVDNSLTSLAGWNTQATGQIQGFGNNTNKIMNQTSDFIGNTAFGPNGPAQQGIVGFIGMALSAFGAGGGGLLGAVINLFSGLGSGLQNVFGGIFGSIGSGLQNIGGFLGDVFGGVVDVGSNLISGIMDFGGSILGAFTDMFFADGGRIKPGSMGIVGEAGPEIVSGPAMVTSTADTASILGRQSGVNVSFTINALDARGIDDLLIERKGLIADIMRDAVASSGRGLR